MTLDSNSLSKHIFPDLEQTGATTPSVPLPTDILQDPVVPPIIVPFPEPTFLRD